MRLGLTALATLRSERQTRAPFQTNQASMHSQMPGSGHSRLCCASSTGALLAATTSCSLYGRHH
eukprot:scaffold207_cov409-Prasinococcus_capsulatus_cf.AAC.52